MTEMDRSRIVEAASACEFAMGAEAAMATAGNLDAAALWADAAAYWSAQAFAIARAQGGAA